MKRRRGRGRPPLALDARRWLALERVRLIDIVDGGVILWLWESAEPLFLSPEEAKVFTLSITAPEGPLP